MRIIAFVIGTLPSMAFADMIAGTDFGYGSWQGAAYTANDTGAFSHCAISAKYNHGNTLYMSVNADATVSVAVQTPSSTFTAEEEFPVALYIDRRKPFYGNAWASDDRFAMLTLDETELAIESLKWGRTLVIGSKYGDIPFDLSGTARALNATINCAIANDGFEKRVVIADAPTVDPALLMQVATGTITTMGANDFTFLTETEVKDLFPDYSGQSVFWSSDSMNLLAGVLVTKGKEGASLKETDTADIGMLSEMCSGDFVTGVRQALEKSVDLREISAKCITDERKSEHFLTKFQVGDRIIYSWLWFSDEAGEAPSPKRSEFAKDAALYAASMIVE